METTGMVLPECANRITRLARIAIAPEQIEADRHHQDPMGLQIRLTPEQRHYLERVRRLQSGDPFLILDGLDHLWLAQLHSEGALIKQVLDPTETELGIDLHLGIAVMKGSGFDDLIRMLTELGVAQITPLLTERTIVQPGSGKLQRWSKIAQEATEQCERLRWPQIHSPQLLSTWLQQIEARPILLAVARREAPHLLTVLQRDLASPRRDPVHSSQRSMFSRSIAVAVGPEGGWTDSEIQMGVEHGAQLISLGQRILRAATAPVVIASLVAAVADIAVRFEA